MRHRPISLGVERAGGLRDGTGVVGSETQRGEPVDGGDGDRPARAREELRRHSKLRILLAMRGDAVDQHEAASGVGVLGLTYKSATSSGSRAGPCHGTNRRRLRHR